MKDAAEALGTYDSQSKTTTMNVPYALVGTNSAGVVRAVVEATGYDFDQHLPEQGGDGGDPMQAKDFPGYNAVIRVNGDGTYATTDIVPGAAPYAIYDTGGTDEFVVPADRVTWIIEDADTNTADEVTIVGLDSGDVSYQRKGNDLVILDGLRPVVIIKDHFAGHPVATLNFDDGSVPTSGLSPNAYIPTALPGWIADPLNLFGVAPSQASPLTVDLDADGIELTSFNAAATDTFFDIDGDGFAEQTAWVSADDGLLVRDLNENGIIDDVTELFGSPTVDGFALLAELDTNGDLRIDASDDDWADLRIWNDSDGDAVTDSGELLTLSSLNIVSIDLVGVTASTSTISGNPISHTSTFKFANGSTATIADAWFVHDEVNTYYTGDYTLDVRALFLPTLRGFGQLADLHIAMSQDAGLLDLVEEFTLEWSFERLADQTSLDADIADILYEWAGVDAVSPTSRGPNVDARHLEFLEEYFGTEFLQWGTEPNPRTTAGAILEGAWDDVFRHLKAHIVVQAGGAALFGGAVSYDPTAGEPTGTFDLSQDAIDDLVDYATATGVDTHAYWVQVAEFLANTKGLTNITATEEGWLDTAIANSGLTDDWDDIADYYENGITTTGITSYGDSGNQTINGTIGDDQLYGEGGADIINGGDGDDLVRSSSSWGSESVADELNGGDGNDELHGDGGDDILDGGAGEDTLTGYYGDDVLIGGAGGDWVYGHYGDDTYVYTSGDDVYSDQAPSTNDKILMPVGIDSNDLTFHIIGGDDLLIEIAGLGSIQIVNQLYSGAGEIIETIEFADTSTLDLLDIDTPAQYGTEGADALYGVTAGTGDFDDEIYGLGGNDTINAYAGSNIVDGGAGNDTISVSGTYDIIVASPGFDSIYSTATYSLVEIPIGYSAAGVTFYRTAASADDLFIFIDGLGQIEVQNMMHSYGIWGIDEVAFADSSPSIMLDDVVITTHGTESGETINAHSGQRAHPDQIIYGYGGNDTIYAQEGNDKLYGGAGNDYINGAGGNDELFYEGGLDSIVESGGTDTLYIQGAVTINDISVSDHAEYSAYDAKIVIDASVDEIVLQSFRYMSSMQVETLSFDDGFYVDLPSYNSWLWGTSGNDNVAGNANANTLIGMDGADTLNAGDAGDHAHGGAGADTIHGDGGDDLLHGGAGDDVLYGDDGFDTLYGGAGADTFMLEATEAFNNVDVIKDFNVANDNDVLDISDILDATSYNHGVDAITDWVEITTSGSDSIVKIDRDGTGGTFSMAQVATLEGITGLTDEAALVTSGNLIAA